MGRVISRVGFRYAAACGLALLTAALLAGLLGTPAARAVTGAHDGTAAVVVAGGAELDAFYVGDSGEIEEIAYTDAAGWGSPTALPGTAGSATSAPAAVVYAGATDVFYRNAAGGLDELSNAGAGWSAPAALPNTAVAAGTAPAASTFRSGGELDVWYEGTDGGLEQLFGSDGHTFGGPAEVAGTAGQLHSGPAAVLYRGGNEVDVFWQGADDGLEAVLYDAGQTSFVGPAEAPHTAGTVLGAPAALLTASGAQMFIAYPTSGSALETIAFTANSWGAPTLVPNTAGTVASTPGGAVYRSGGEVDLFYVNPAGTLEQLTYTTGAGYSGPTTPMPASTPSPTTTTTTTTAPPPPVTASTGTGGTTVAPKRTARRLHVKLTLYWYWTPAETRLRRVKLSRAPSGTHIRVACRGGGCPTAALAVGPRGRAGLWHALEQRHYRPGARLVITFTRRGVRHERVVVKINAGERPDMALG